VAESRGHRSFVAAPERGAGEALILRGYRTHGRRRDQEAAQRAQIKIRDRLGAYRQELEEISRLLLQKEVIERPELLAIFKFRNIDDRKDKDPAGSEVVASTIRRRRACE